MIRKIGIFFLAFCLWAGGNLYAEAANYVQIKMDGVAVQQEQAIEKAQERAVFKVLSHLTRANNEPQSPFSKIMRKYKNYVTDFSTIKIFDNGAEVQVILNVVVNHQKLQDDLSNEIFAKQLKNADKYVALNIYAVNTSDNEILQEQIVTAFNKHFGEFGIQTAYGYEDNTSGNYAVTGAIKIISIKANPAGKGYIAEAEAELRLYDAQEKVIASYKEDYKILANTMPEAERLVIQKVSMDSAEYMSQKILQMYKM